MFRNRNSKSRSTVRRRARSVLAVFVATAGALTVASPAMAYTWDGRLDVTDSNGRWVSHTLYNHDYVWNGEQVHGAAADIASWDGRCTRVYTKGYNYALGWTGWHHVGTACAGGSTSWSNTYTVYSDHIRVALCSGYIGGMCTSRQVA